MTRRPPVLTRGHTDELSVYLTQRQRIAGWPPPAQVWFEFMFSLYILNYTYVWCIEYINNSMNYLITYTSNCGSKWREKPKQESCFLLMAKGLFVSTSNGVERIDVCCRRSPKKHVNDFANMDFSSAFCSGRLRRRKVVWPDQYMWKWVIYLK